MPVQVSIRESVSRGRPHRILVKAVNEGLLIRDYINAEISLGELAELLGMEYIEARDWLHRQGIATARKLPPDLAANVQTNQEKISQELGIT